MISQDSRLNKSRGPNDDSLDMVQRHMRYVANQQRRATPPRCHPISIYILIQACGCIFVGMTMIITANWPGTGSRSSNILKIFGPILMAIGAILLLIGILLARFLRKREAKTWDQKISQHILSASRQVLDQSIPIFHGQPPTKQLLGQATEEERTGLLGSPEDLKTELKKASMFGGSESETFNSSSSALPRSPLNNDDVPDPVRITKTRKKNTESSSSFENLDSLREDDEHGLIKERLRKASRDDQNGDEVRTTKKTVKTTTVVTRRIVEGEESPMKLAKRPKPPPIPQKSSTVPDSPRLRVKVKAATGTSVNIRHSGSSYDGEATNSQPKKQDVEVQKKPKVRAKPKLSKSPLELHGSDI